MAASVYQGIRDSLRELYLEDDRPWLVGFSGGKDSMLAKKKECSESRRAHGLPGDLGAHHDCCSATSRN